MLSHFLFHYKHIQSSSQESETCYEFNYHCSYTCTQLTRKKTLLFLYMCFLYFWKMKLFNSHFTCQNKTLCSSFWTDGTIKSQNDIHVYMVHDFIYYNYCMLDIGIGVFFFLQGIPKTLVLYLIMFCIL